MAIRLLTSLGTGAVVTFALLWLMQILIATGKEALTDKAQFSFVDFVRVKQEELIEQKKPKPDKPPEVEEKPPEALSVIQFSCGQRQGRYRHRHERLQLRR